MIPVLREYLKVGGEQEMGFGSLQKIVLFRVGVFNSQIIGLSTCQRSC